MQNNGEEKNAINEDINACSHCVIYFFANNKKNDWRNPREIVQNVTKKSKPKLNTCRRIFLWSISSFLQSLKTSVQVEGMAQKPKKFL